MAPKGLAAVDRLDVVALLLLRLLLFINRNSPRHRLLSAKEILSRQYSMTKNGYQCPVPTGKI